MNCVDKTCVNFKFSRFINENKLKHFSCSSKYMSVRRNGRDKDTDFS